MSHLCTEAIPLEALLTGAVDTCGANLLFTGTVRDSNEGRAVSGMHYSAHLALAEKALAEICLEAQARFAIQHCHIVHRLGELRLGEISVAITVRSAHRDAAYVASRWAIETLKARVPIWKEERYIDGDSAFLDGQTLEQAL
jgi:molybdopterin synthase catalytic subunit